MSYTKICFYHPNYADTVQLTYKPLILCVNMKEQTAQFRLGKLFWNFLHL